MRSAFESRRVARAGISDVRSLTGASTMLDATLETGIGGVVVSLNAAQRGSATQS
jgi:hypothetical protein